MYGDVRRVGDVVAIPPVRSALDVALIAVPLTVFIVGAGLLFTEQLVWTLCLGAFLCGMAESNGRCGLSHIGMTAPLRTAAPTIWRRSCTAYTVCGVLTAFLVGACIATVSNIGGLQGSYFLYGIALVIGVAIVARELDWIDLPLPQWNRQTNKAWVHEFGLPTAAGMWGAHIGVGLVTVVRHGGLYVLVVLCATFGLQGGEYVFPSFWIGRVVLLWFAPSLTGRERDGTRIVKMLRSNSPAFARVSVYGISLLVLVATKALLLGWVVR